jgi:hypothetical protein
MKDAAKASKAVQFSPYSFYGPGGMFAGTGTMSAANAAAGAGPVGAAPGVAAAPQAGKGASIFGNLGARIKGAQAPGPTGAPVAVPGGGSFNPSSPANQSIYTSLGDLDPARQAFLQNMTTALGDQQLPDYVYGAAADASDAFNPYGGFGVNPAAAYTPMSPYDRDAEARLRSTGMSALDIAGMDPQALGQQRHGLEDGAQLIALPTAMTG